MTERERHRRAKEIFLEAVDLAPEEREAYLREACRGAPSLLAEVTRMVALDEEAMDDLFGTPAAVGLGFARSDPDTVERIEELSDEPPVTDWDRYTVLERLGGGGMGEVYKAYDPRLKRFIALKFIRRSSRQLVERFLREAEAQARVEHENVLKVYETGEVEGQLYIAMQYVDGPTLNQVRSETGVEARVSIMCQVADGVHAAHRQGLVHRDIKPSNILIERSQEGRLKPYVMDFGIAAITDGPGITSTGEILGTPWYMAPERVVSGSQTPDRRSDVYSLGATMYELLSGRRAIETDSPLEMLSLLQQREPEALRRVQPDLPGDLATIVMKCLERDPERRYQSARALAEDLRRYLDDEPILARPPSLPYRLIKKTSKNKAMVAISVTALAALLLMAGLSLRTYRQSREREILAQEFGRQIEEMEYPMRMARLAELHAVGREKSLVRERMAAIRERLEEVEMLGEGSGHYALGRGYLAIGEYQRAREPLERAWSRGYRRPAVATALGQALGGLYQRHMADAVWILDDEIRARRQQEIEQTYRDPALSYLRLGGGAGHESPEYVDGLIALFAGNHEEALRQARAAYERLPWLHEAMKLEGDVYTEIVFQSWRRSEPDGARRAYGKALRAYDTALKVAQSDASAYAAMSRLERVMMEITLRSEQADVRAHFQRALQACDHALHADPDQPDNHRLRSDLYRTLAASAMVRGDDPRPALAEAQASARRALELRPVDALACLAMGDAFMLQADCDSTAGGDPTNALAAAVTAYERAVEIDPRSERARARLEATRKRATELEPPTVSQS